MSWSKRDWFFCLLLAVVTMLAYHPAWHGGVLWDDDAHIGGPELRTLDGLRRIWFVPRTTQQYYPLLHTSYWLQQKLWGDSITGYHIVSLLLHIGCVVLVLRIVRFLRIPGAELAATIFALHPVNVETVAWIAERKNTLSGVFVLAATLWYLRFDENRSRRSYVLALGLFLLGLLSKTAIVTLPLALLVIFWWKRGAISWRHDVVPLIPFFFFSAAAGLMTRWVEYGNIGYRARMLDLSLLDRCLIAGRAFWFYLWKLLWPSNLMFVYPRWEISAAVPWQYIFPLAVLVLLGILWSLRRWSRTPLAGVLVYMVLLLPSLGFANIYFFLYSFVADYWQYLACLGINPAFGRGVCLLATRLKSGYAWLEPGVTLVIGGVLFLLTWQQSRMYNNAETLYRTTIAHNPACWLAYDHFVDILYQANRIPEAMNLFKYELRIKPAVAHYSLGNALLRKGRTSEAIDQFTEALRMNPNSADAHSNLGAALAQMGRISEAIEELKAAVRINPNNIDARNNLIYVEGLQKSHQEKK